jgi:cytochrome c5
MKYSKLLFQIALLTLLNQFAFANDKTSEVIETEHYRTVNGKVDPKTFIGWNVYHQVCVRCHGVGAVGDETAPDLTESIERLSPGQFKLKVLHTKIVKFTGDDWRAMEEAMLVEIEKHERRSRGELETMPRWKYNPAVTANVNNIYRYLKARADGVIGEGKPGILK